MGLLITFIVFNIINVIIQTAKSICTIKCNKYVAAIVNALAYGLYTYIVILTVCELPLWTKIVTVAGANLIGVFIVKLIEEKKRKDMVWKVETTVDKNKTEDMAIMLKKAKVPYNFIDNVGRYTIFNIFCETQAQSSAVREILKNFKVKYFVTESKIL